MEDLDNITYQAINRYFTVLEKTGYIKDSDVNKLILLQFLQNFVYEYQGYITEEDYNTINLIITCLIGSSCLIPFKQYKQMTVPMQNYMRNIPVRVVEQDDQTLRQAQSEFGLRLVNQ